MTIRLSASLAALLLLAACARGEDAGPLENVADNTLSDDMTDDSGLTGNATSEVLPTDAWVGKWIGVEGLVLDIQQAGEPGRYVLSVTLLDGTKSFDGTAEGDVIRFTRDGRPESIRAATGAQTGLKWLADKKNCLMIQQGEGFCRDEPVRATGAPPATLPAASPVAPPATLPAAPPAQP